MSHIGLADLLGVRAKATHWERPLFFFAALFYSDLVWLVIYQLFTWLSGESNSFSISNADDWLNAMLVNLLLALFATLTLRWLPYTPLAILATALSYGLLSNLIPYTFIPYAITFVSELSELFRYLGLPEILMAALWPLFLLGAVGLAVRRLKPLWLALLTGSVVGSLANLAALLIISRFTLETEKASEFTTFMIERLPFRLLDATIFAVVWWAGLRFTAGRDLGAERKKTRLTKSFYLAAVMMSVGASQIMLASTLSSIIFREWSSRSDTDVDLVFAGLVGIFGSIVFLILTYKMWDVIQDGYARTSPRRAIGLLFVPFFNLYWIFQVYRGFAKDFNNFVSHHSINTPLLPTGLFTAYGVLAILSGIPFLGLLLLVVNFFVMLVMISKICDAVNSIPEKLPDQEAGGPVFHIS